MEQPERPCRDGAGPGTIPGGHTAWRFDCHHRDLYEPC